MSSCYKTLSDSIQDIEAKCIDLLSLKCAWDCICLHSFALLLSDMSLNAVADGSFI